VTRDEIRSLLRDVGACGESDDKKACLLPPGHQGPHGFESSPGFAGLRTERKRGVRRFYYFGCRGSESGHYLHGGSSAHLDHLDDGFPVWMLDGTFAPLDANDRTWCLTQLRHQHHVVSILACHDNTIDKRPGSNAAFVVIDETPWDAEHILAQMRERFPDCWERLKEVRCVCPPMTKEKE
jgi:hypothetical protein